MRPMDHIGHFRRGPHVDFRCREGAAASKKVRSSSAFDPVARREFGRETHPQAGPFFQNTHSASDGDAFSKNSLWQQLKRGNNESMKQTLCGITLSFLLVSAGLAQLPVLISDFSADENITPHGGSWLSYDPAAPNSDFALNSNESRDYIFGDNGPQNFLNITGAQGLSLTAHANFITTPPNQLHPGQFQILATNGGGAKATANFNFLDFVSPSPVTVFQPFVSIDPSFNYSTFDQWYIVGNGNPTALSGEITFSRLEAAAVPESSSLACLLLAGVAAVTWQFRRALKRA